MRVDKTHDIHGDRREQMYLPNSAASSRTVTPLPQIQVKSSALAHISNVVKVKSGKSDLSMHEVQRLAQIKEKALQRSTVHCSGSDLHVPARAALMHEARARPGGKDGEGRRKKRNAMAELIEADMKMKEISQSRAMFNRKADALPSIGQSCSGFTPASGKLPKIAEPGVKNNVLDIINRHEPNVRLTSTLREIGQEYMSTAAKDITEPITNTAPEVIIRNEAKVGKAYHGMAYGEYAKYFEEEEMGTSPPRTGSRGSRKSH